MSVDGGKPTNLNWCRMASINSMSFLVLESPSSKLAGRNWKSTMNESMYSLLKMGIFQPAMLVDPGGLSPCVAPRPGFYRKISVDFFELMVRIRYFFSCELSNEKKPPRFGCLGITKGDEIYYPVFLCYLQGFLKKNLANIRIQGSLWKTTSIFTWKVSNRRVWFSRGYCWVWLGWCKEHVWLGVLTFRRFETWKCSRWWFQIFFVFTPILEKKNSLTNIFGMGWNHQLVLVGSHFLMFVIFFVVLPFFTFWKKQNKKVWFWWVQIKRCCSNVVSQKKKKHSTNKQQSLGHFYVEFFTAWMWFFHHPKC